MRTLLTMVLGCSGPGDEPAPDDSSTPRPQPCERYADADSDGFGDPAVPTDDCDALGFVDDATDCDDADATVFPGAPLVCDSEPDQDCDGQPDADGLDADGDGVTPCDGDCDDASDAVHPSGEEVCNDGIDDDCDGAIDDADDSVDVYSCGYCPDPALYDQATFLRFTLDPCELDPQTTCIEDHVHRLVARSDGHPFHDELLLFVPPGPGNKNDTLLTWGAYAGFRVISLGWMNGDWIERCQLEPDIDQCLEDVRYEQLFGVDTSPLDEVGPYDSIEHRLAVLLQHLDATFPNDDWERYYNAKEGIRWDRIIAWGWSYGAGTSAFMSRHLPLDGTIMIGGPKEAVWPTLRPAYWTSDPPAMETCSQFAIYHRLEEWTEPGETLPLSLEYLGLEGTVDLDANLPPYDGAQILTTESSDFQLPDCNYHAAVGQDGCMDQDVLLPAYLHMLCSAASIDTCMP